MEISVIGTGYVGLVAGTCFSESGQTVTCVDINPDRIKKLQDGVIPIYEPGLEELVKQNLKQERLFFTTNTEEAIKKSNVIFIAVGTPSQSDGSSDLSQVYAVAHTLSQVSKTPKIVVLKSTVPVGTATTLKAFFKEKTSQAMSVVSNPEFLKEGTAVQDFLRPERVVVGSDSPKALEVLKEIYEPFVRSGNPILEMDNTSAELSKYACSSFLAMKIYFINEMANLCSTLRADINHIRRVMMSDSRIGNKFLY